MRQMIEKSNAMIRKIYYLSKPDWCKLDDQGLKPTDATVN